MVENCKIKLYADDSKLYAATNNLIDCENIETDLKNIEKYLEKWQLDITMKLTCRSMKRIDCVVHGAV